MKFHPWLRRAVVSAMTTAAMIAGAVIQAPSAQAVENGECKMTHVWAVTPSGDRGGIDARWKCNNAKNVKVTLQVWTRIADQWHEDVSTWSPKTSPWTGAKSRVFLISLVAVAELSVFGRVCYSVSYGTKCRELSDTAYS